METSGESGIEHRLEDLCVVVPAHNEQESLPLLIEELERVLHAEGIHFDVVFVDDGSDDGTREVIEQLVAKYSNVKGLVLSRNFGHQAAVSVGLQYAKGRAIAVMDADLQDSPKHLVTLFRQWESGADVVYAVRGSRTEGVFLRLAYRVFYRALGRVSNIKIPLDSGDFCVMDAGFVDRLNALPERLRYVRGLRAWLGGKQVPVRVDRGSRQAGRPSYSIPMLLKLAVDGFVSFSYAPLRVASLAGMVVSGFAFIGIVVVLTWKAFGLLPSGAGVATIALSVLFLGGVQLLTIGILGEYVGRVFEEVKGRPIAVVSDLIERAPDCD